MNNWSDSLIKLRHCIRQASEWAAEGRYNLAAANMRAAQDLARDAHQALIAEAERRANLEISK